MSSSPDRKRTGRTSKPTVAVTGAASRLGEALTGKLAVGGSANLIRVWNLTADNEPVELFGHAGSVSCLAWNNARGVLASGSFDTTVRLWKLGEHSWTEPVRQAARKK